MPELLRQTRPALAVAPLLLALLMLGCGGEDESGSTVTAAPQASMFPDADGQTLEEMATEAEPSELVVAPSQQVFEKGENRYGFGVFTLEGDNFPDAEVALYAAPPNGEAIGPFPAASASLATGPAFRSVSTSGDPDAATVVYTSDVDLSTDGEWRVMAMFREEDGTYSATNVPSAVVGQFPEVPDPGEKAPVISTPTAKDVGGDLTKIDTRQPPSTMHEVDYAEVAGKEPVVLLFATPALCSSRVCGPVADIAEEVKSERPEDAAFVHMEIYEDNTPPKLREQVRAFDLPTEPWLFVIDSDGRVSTRIEGAFSEGELNAALDEVR